jgi:hypothetical protein
MASAIVLPTPAELREKADAYDTLIWDRLNFDGKLKHLCTVLSLRRGYCVAPPGAAQCIHTFDEALYIKHRLTVFLGPEIQPFVDSNQFPYPNLKSGPSNPMMNIIGKSWSTLTSLNLDWILWRQHGSNDDTQAINDLQQLSQLRFPNLRSFQLRNAVVPEAGLPEGVYR